MALGSRMGRVGVTEDGQATRRVWVAVGVCAAVLVLPLVGLVKIQGRQDDLHRRGVVTSAVVVGIDRGGTDHLVVEYEACRCSTRVTTSSPGRHPIGSVLPIRYDRLRPSRAEALVDRPNPYRPVLLALLSFGLAVLLVVPIIVVAGRRPRRLRQARTVVETSGPRFPVRVEAWRRSSLLATIYPTIDLDGVGGVGGPPGRIAIFHDASEAPTFVRLRRALPPLLALLQLVPRHVRRHARGLRPPCSSPTAGRPAVRSGRT